MDIERRIKVQIGAGLVSVVVFVGLVLLVAGRNGMTALEPDEGLGMVAVLAFFVIFTAALGLALSGELSEE
jgi:predicted cation transporter